MLKSKSLILFAALFLITSSLAWAATLSVTEPGEHAIDLSGGTQTYSNPIILKAGDMTGQDDDYDWKGTNAAVLARNGAVLTITGGTINSNASYGNAIFSYGGNNSNTNNNQGDGTTINISDTAITTTKNNSGGIMTTGGGIMNASNLTISTSGNSSAAIRSDSGGGSVNVSGGTYTATGQGSPAVYSTANINISDADLNSGVAQGVVIEGGNSVTLKDSNIKANHTRKNGQDSTYQAILIYKSMSKDASDGQSSFTMTDGSITNAGGDIFCITNTTCTINLTNVTITNNDPSGNFLRAEGQNWGRSGSNGGVVTLNTSAQNIEGDIIVASDSSLVMNLKDSSSFKGAINASTLKVSSSSVSASDAAGDVSVVIERGSKLILTGNSYISSLTTDYTNGIEYGDYFINVNGKEYTKDSRLSGTLGEGNSDNSADGEDIDINNNDGSDSDSDQSVTTSSSGGGCNTGFTGIVILTCALIMKKK